MIPALFLGWCMAAPMGFLAGDVVANQIPMSPELKSALPYLAAIITPLGALLAVMAIIYAESNKELEDE